LGAVVLLPLDGVRVIASHFPHSHGQCLGRLERSGGGQESQKKRDRAAAGHHFDFNDF